MSSKIRWLHLSDFHVGMDNYGQRKLLREICDHIKQMVCNEFVPDFVFITGDIANFGLASEYQEFFEYFLAPMSESLGKLWDGKIISVPGNHDVNRHRSPHFSPDQILASVGNLFDPTEAGKLSRAQFADRFQDYIQNDTSGVPNNWLNTKDGSFAIKAAVRSSNVGIVGVNTAWLSKDDKDRHKLTPGKHLLDDALNQLQDCKLKIVLGHHPIDWLDDGQAQMIRVLLGKHSCLYLHGHLHENDARYDDGGRGEFLAIRCGSAFQGRADDKPRWINGLMWAEANIDERKIEIRPFHWSAQHEEWKLTTDAFPNKYETMGKWTFPLPGSNTHHGHQIPPKALSKSTARSQNEYLPPGWVLVDRQFIEERMGEVIDERLLQFFDGSPPTWRIALSSFVPQRELVENLRSRFNHLDDAVKPSVINLLGPSGEGKSTVFFQTIAKLVVEDGWVALWRYNDLAQIDVMAIQKLFSKYQKLLVAIDDAHSLASRFATGLSRLGRAPIAHFLLCSRTLDWRAEVREMGSITVASDYQELTCHGISPLDASLIVNAWAHLGKKGLGALAHIPLSDAADALLKASRDTENDLEEGAFFGAMLQLRYGDKLKDRIRTVLYRLNAIQESGPPVLDAYAIIAAMHAEGLRFLSTPVLAEYLGLPASDLQKMVMRPLADEALAAGGGRFLLCRHKSIAKASISVLRETNLFGDIEGVFGDLGHAAIVVRHKGAFVPDLAGWNYRLPQHFLDAGNAMIAVGSAEKMLSADPDDLHMRVNLSKIYRSVEQSERSAELFRDYAGQMGRAAWHEWAVAELRCNNEIVAILLAAISVCDIPGIQQVSLDQALMSATTIASCVEEIYRATKDPDYESVIAAITLIINDLKESKGPAQTSDVVLLESVIGRIMPQVDFDTVSKGRVPRNSIGRFERLRALIERRSAKV